MGDPLPALPAGVDVVRTGDWDLRVLRADGPVVVGFWAPWCVPCRMAAPALAEAAGQYAGRARFGVVDVDAEPDLARRYAIVGLPTVLVFKGGEVCQRRVGLMGRARLRAVIEGCLTAAPSPSQARG